MKITVLSIAITFASIATASAQPTCYTAGNQTYCYSYDPLPAPDFRIDTRPFQQQHTYRAPAPYHKIGVPTAMTSDGGRSIFQTRRVALLVQAIW